ncbi:hypothetical protein [Aeoliella mucimassa]|uniref:Uncharacterized protein n=1 Tax=Aeoliella mucimassa TaxID=2527972 RepID=A0A518AM31_9BACT|nr:hypothetical protein [Aeoliella mucimassa]QDU55776.1 hypothetical protein Pan181_19720 [Aeoliella mucimassa]
MYPITKALLGKSGEQHLLVAEWQNTHGRCREWTSTIHDVLLPHRSYHVFDRYNAIVYKLEPGFDTHDLHWRDAIMLGRPVELATDFTPPMAGDFVNPMDERFPSGALIVAALYCGMFIAEETIDDKDYRGEDRYYLLGADLVPMTVEDRPHYVTLGDAMAAAVKLEKERDRFHFMVSDFASVEKQGGAV